MIIPVSVNFPQYATILGEIILMDKGSWFAWANSVFAQTILDIARRKPHLIFGEGAEPYIVD